MFRQKVLLLAGVVKAGCMPAGRVIAASGRMWLGFAMNCGWTVIIMASTLLLLDYGSFGLASVRLIGSSVHAVWVSAFAIHFIRRQVSGEKDSTDWAVSGC